MEAADFGHTPGMFVLLTGLVFFAWGAIYSLFPPTCAYTFGRHEMRSGECGLLHMSTGACGAYAALKVNTDAPISNRCRSFTHPPFEGAFVSSITSCHGALPFSFLTPLSSDRARPSDISPASPTLRGKHQASAHVFADAFAST
jgi:hypothetical protein